MTVLVHSGMANAGVDCDRIREDELACLACNIYHEARGEPEFGQVMVGVVTANRVQSKHFPNSYCEVVWADKQFSWTDDGRSDVTREEPMWQRSRVIAKHVISEFRQGGRFNLPGAFANATHYHNLSVYPRWADDFANAAQLGHHIFYSN